MRETLSAMQRPIDSKLVEVYYSNYDSFFTASLLDFDEGTDMGTLACLNCHSYRCPTRHQIPINALRVWVPPQSDASMQTCQYSEGELVEVRFQKEGFAPYWVQGRISGGPVSDFPPSYFVIFRNVSCNNTFSTTSIRKASGLPLWYMKKDKISIPSKIVEHARDSLDKIARLRLNSTGGYFVRLIFDVADELCARENFNFRISQLERIADLNIQLDAARENNPQHYEVMRKEIIVLEKAMDQTPAEFRLCLLERIANLTVDLAAAREQNPQRRESTIREVIMLENAMEMASAAFRNYPPECCEQQRCTVPDVVQRHQQQRRQQQQQQQVISRDDTAIMIITCARGAHGDSAVARTLRCFSCQGCCNDFMIALQRQALEEHWWRRLHEEQRQWQMREHFRRIRSFLQDFFWEPLRTTPAEVMARLPSYAFQCISGAAPVECAVCLEALQADDIARDLPCRHTFHMKCIDTWLSSNHTCPLCRQDLLKS